MNNRQILVISGKTCTGKTGLADLLEHEYGFFVVRTRDVLSQQLHLTPLNADRASLINQGHEQDRATGSKWVLEAVRRAVEGLSPDCSVVVDHVSSSEQVREFRKTFGPNLVHVHLWASAATLDERYEAGEGSKPDARPYDEIDHLKDDDEIRALKHDADVRIYTSRSDARDTLVRVAARLHLFTPPDVRLVDVLIGGQYGSEGKGNVVSYLAREYDVIVRVGGPNAGHTVASIHGPYTYHHLPSGSRDVTARLLLGPGMTINLKGLFEEIEQCNITADRLYIDPQALIIEDEDITTEKGRLVGSIASTGSGSGAAMARRILKRGDESIRLARDVPELEQYVGTKGNYRGTTTDRLEEAYRAGQSILLEGTQGSGLSIFHGIYPYVTSRDTNVAGCLAEAGISPSRVRKILMVIRPMPIRVGDPDGVEGRTSGPLKHPTTFDDVAVEAKLEATSLHKAEKTSTTKRKRRVGWFEWEQYRKACALNAPTDIVLAFADYVEGENKNARRFEQLTQKTIKFIEELERVAQAPVSLINTRFPREPDGTDDLRSVIDRRNWTARSSIQAPYGRRKTD